ncbi:MAG TPA: nucleotidyltransferase family protein [Actinomycetota bacterium]|nr:nucleotidyltransferase family protein [Actinomycetota bacterium]
MSEDANDQEAATEVFREVISIFEREGFDYAVGGGLCTSHWIDGADHISDIDLVIREEDAPRILETLAVAGFESTEMERSWLHKAFKRGVTVDLMFELKNGTRIDAELLGRRKKGEMFGTVAYVMAPEDQAVSLAAALARDTIGDNWYSIIDLMAKNDLDWDYVVQRSRKIPLRMLSCVYFALEERVPVAAGVVEQLIELADRVDDT